MKQNQNEKKLRKIFHKLKVYENLFQISMENEI